MTFVFQNRERAKKAAQRIAKALPDVKLSAVQEGLARALGYQDWFAFEQSPPDRSPSILDQDLSDPEFLARADHQIGALASYLDIPDSDAQYALSAARLTGDRNWSREDHMMLRLSAWRRGPLLAAKPRGRGDLVRIKASGRPREYGYVLSHGERGAKVLLEDSILTCATFEVVRPKVRPADFIPSRYWRPYGYWTLEDGSKVLFSRDYYPLWRVGGDRVERLGPWLWIGPRKGQTYFFDLSGEPNWLHRGARSLSEAFLEDHGVRGLPILADAVLQYFNEGVDRPEEAVRAEHKRRGSPTDAPAYARLNAMLA
ncbi:MULTISPECIES: hypothetical protein [unclassified Caulobacter]|jgi:hypothetical protein|uniref:hypothetical protein n=1 Tax=unclassified Caulobacter TaxID=2648921 RepID=UPI000785D506|nr:MULTISPECIES: hypothetical protein [unclassified Caulobacter]AZS21724.1 hypothetical protein CSW63_14405 [Caulobacter sp. FWC26]